MTPGPGYWRWVKGGGTTADTGPERRRVLITGGSSGIGLVTARRFAAADADVAVIARNEAGLKAVRALTRAAGRECLTFTADVTKREALTAQVEAAAEELGGLDVVVVNVGASTYGRFRDTPAPDFDRVVDVTFRGAVDTVRAVLPRLEESEGVAVVIGSVASELPLPRMAAYTAAKHALRGFVEALRVELRAQSSPVSVALIEPGPVDTPFWGNVANPDGLLPPKIPLAYRPQEVAVAIEQSLRIRDRTVTVGGAWVALRLAHRVARPLGRRILGALTRLVERHGKRGRGKASIWTPAGEGEPTFGLRRRPSIAIRARELLTRSPTSSTVADDQLLLKGRSSSHNSENFGL